MLGATSEGHKQMTKRLHSRSDERRESADPLVWINVPALVAENEDPEHRHRIRVVVPALDEDAILDDWVEQLGTYSGSGGYGDFAVPAIGSEVRLFGEFGQGDNLAYLCVYNEHNLTPGDSDDETTRVIRAPGDLKIICAGDLFLEGGRVLMQSRFGTIQQKAAAGLITDPEGDS
jgi:hypothetical protein